MMIDKNAYSQLHIIIDIVDSRLSYGIMIESITIAKNIDIFLC